METMTLNVSCLFPCCPDELAIGACKAQGSSGSLAEEPKVTTKIQSDVVSISYSSQSMTRDGDDDDGDNDT